MRGPSFDRLRTGSRLKARGDMRGEDAMANNRTAIVTGAAHGIGRAVARHLVRQGWRVALADIDGEAVSAATAEIGGAALSRGVSRGAGRGRPGGRRPRPARARSADRVPYRH